MFKKKKQDCFCFYFFIHWSLWPHYSKTQNPQHFPSSSVMDFSVDWCRRKPHPAGFIFNQPSSYCLIKCFAWLASLPSHPCTVPECLALSNVVLSIVLSAPGPTGTVLLQAILQCHPPPLLSGITEEGYVIKKPHPIPKRPHSLSVQ